MPTYNNLEYIRVMRQLPSFVKRDIYNIPFIEKDDIDISALNNGKWLINLKNCTSRDKNAQNKIVHCFCFDKELNREYQNPFRFLSKVAPYEAASTLDFSMHPDMGFKEVLQATYDNRWSGAFLQSNGKKVIPTVGWVGPEYYDITFAGLRNGGVFIISTLGVNNPGCRQLFLSGYLEMRKRFPDSKIICVGNYVSGMDSDVCFVKYEDSFGSWNIELVPWQPRLLNWDMSLFEGGDHYVV
ncbi:MAG: DUF4417 domain-containing protein [Clostridiales bacterium]|nr:DUF4417 domain-containing protein [Clostridiales bacterium]